MIEFTRLSSGELFVTGHESTPTEIRGQLDDFLRSEGFSAWDADNLAGGATFERSWYSPTVGFMHDCAGHLPEEAVQGCSDNGPVIIVQGVPSNS